jgi:ATP-dependent RNA helicase DDX10/DBP4
LAKRSGKGTKLRFDDEGVAHQIYDLVSEAEFRAQGPLEEMQLKFGEDTAKKIAVMDGKDREEDKEKKRRKQAKRGDRMKEIYE